MTAAGGFRVTDIGDRIAFGRHSAGHGLWGDISSEAVFYGLVTAMMALACASVRRFVVRLLRIYGMTDHAAGNAAPERGRTHRVIIVTLHVGQFHEEQRRHWQRLLRRLQSNGDRIYISASEKLKDFLEVDSSVFHLVLEPAA